MNVWRLGTNWGGTATFDIILENKVGFFGIDWSTDGVGEDDIIAIAKPGTRVVAAIGIAATKVQPLSLLLSDEEKRGELSEWVDDAKGFRFKEIWVVPEDKQFSTVDYKQFYSLGNDAEAWEKAVQLVSFFQSAKNWN